MYEKENKNNYKGIIFSVAFALALALILGFAFRPLVSKAASSESTTEDATLTDANERLQEFRDAANVASTSDIATSTDVDRSPYLTNDVTLLQTNDLLLSIRNLLICVWFTIFLIWAYDRMKAIILRLGGFRNDK